MTDTRLLLDRALADEPPLGLTLDPVVAAGRRIRRRRTAGRAAAAAGALSLVAAGTVAAGPFGGPDRLAPRPAAAPPAAPPRQAVDPSLTADQRAVARAIIDASPPGWRFDLAPDRWDRYDVDATADDGRGAGELHVRLVARGQRLRPCDAPGAGAVDCTERDLPDGSVLTVRRFPVTADGRRQVSVTLAHPDGTGVDALATNFTFDRPIPDPATDTRTDAERRSAFQVTRTRPVYGAAGLTEVVFALDRAVAETPIVLTPAPGEGPLPTEPVTPA
jgi:hypothetical protein